MEEHNVLKHWNKPIILHGEKIQKAIISVTSAMKPENLQNELFLNLNN
jgi:hypothetical protein